jgi:hypothetical protein
MNGYARLTTLIIQEKPISLAIYLITFKDSEISQLVLVSKRHPLETAAETLLLIQAQLRLKLNHLRF